jgi:RimJ/RimL family protein N-acetyltransferase
MPPRLIKTARLLLRRLEMADAPGIARLVGDLEVTRWLTVVPHPYAVADAETFIREAGADWRFGIEIDGLIAGVIGVQKQLGYWLGQRYWGRGYMTEAVYAVVNAWFLAGEEALGSGYFVDNHRSGAILRKMGFRCTEVVTQHSLAQGCDVQCQKMVLSAVDWQARNG